MSILILLAEIILDFAFQADESIHGFIKHPNAMGEIIKGNYVKGFKGWDNEFEFVSLPVKYSLQTPSVVEENVEFWQTGYYDT